mgnify:CR=1 FL=1
MTQLVLRNEKGDENRMPENYWSDLLSMVAKTLSDEGFQEAAYVVKAGEFELRFRYHDNWDGGIDYSDCVFYIKYRDYIVLEEKLGEITSQIESAIQRFYRDERDRITDVLIEPLIERIIDWNAIAPENKDNVIQLIIEERNLLEAIATGGAYIRDEGVDEVYKKRHLKICELSKKAGFDYPISYNSLWEWWSYIKPVGGYADRRTRISELFEPIIKTLTEAEVVTDAPRVVFDRIATRTSTTQAALSDADAFMNAGRFDSALDRIHTAFHGYLRKLLTDYEVSYVENDSLPKLYAMLHFFYGSRIQPPEVGNLVKTSMRSAAGIISVLNEARNRHTVAHPNATLIQRREAKLVIQMIKVMVDYIEEIEKTEMRSEIQ